MKFKITIEVDEEILREEVKELFEDNSSIKDLVEAEFGWLHTSGIYLEDIEEVEEE